MRLTENVGATSQRHRILPPAPRRGSRSGRAGVWLTACLALAAAAPASAQSSSRPFEITDNSFLVEEAFNQEPGIFQNILVAHFDRHGDWALGFTQEWPLGTRRHQISYTVPYASISETSGFGDAALHYRLQATEGDGTWPAVSPRVSLVVPSGRRSQGLGNGHVGWEVNLPLSKQMRDLFVHANAGFTHLPAARVDDRDRNVFIPRAAGSAIWRVRPMLNLMMETVVQWDPVFTTESSTRTVVATFAPGLRTGWNAGDTQTILGVGVPIVVVDGTSQTGILVYASYELPFVRR